MKRLGNIYAEVFSINNLLLADKKARKGKRTQPGVMLFDKNRTENFFNLHEMLKNKTYKTSDYVTFKIFEPKQRDIFRLPYFPDRIAHHAVMNVLEKMFVSIFTTNTFSCIKKRGISGAMRSIRKALNNSNETQYCLKIDIKKFYPNVDHDILKELIRHKIKDENLLWLLDEIIQSTDGLPIGNYLSQYLSNFYLTYFDHWIKEDKKVKYYFRYADDIIILSDNKPYLHKLLFDMRDYLSLNLKLTIKDNYQIFPVKSRGIDFVGYVFYHTHTMLRKSIKQRYARMLHKNDNSKSRASYKGWTDHANCKNLVKKLLKN